jgi:hypothetical protein
MYKIISAVVLAAVFVSCKNSGNSQPADVAPAAPVTITAPPPPTTSQTAPPENTSTGGATAALNPAHGAPGHRCDIPVGAPLNSPAGATAPAAAGPAPVQTQPLALPQPGNSNERLNPAHGAPGHDCSIPVGQPLKG